MPKSVLGKTLISPDTLCGSTGYFKYVVWTSKQMSVYIGLDLSLVSPGVAVYIPTNNNQWFLYGFAQRVREQELTKTHHNTSIIMLPPIPTASRTTTNEERYEHIRHYIVDVIMARYTNSPCVTVGIESYAFGAKNSGSSYKLQELGGVVKHSIWKQYPHWRQEMIPPSQWKKKTIGNGRATKTDVVAHVVTHGPSAPIMDLLGFSSSKTGEIPCPVQDLADAACICLSTTIPNENVTRKKRRRSDPQVPQGSSLYTQ